MSITASGGPSAITLPRTSKLTVPAPLCRRTVVAGPRRFCAASLRNSACGSRMDSRSAPSAGSGRSEGGERRGHQRIQAHHPQRHALALGVDRGGVEFDHRTGQRDTRVLRHAREHGLVEAAALRAQFEVGLAVDLAHRRAELAERGLVDEVHRECQGHAQRHGQHRHRMAQRLVAGVLPRELREQRAQRCTQPVACRRRSADRVEGCGAGAAHWKALRAARCGIRAWARPGALMPRTTHRPAAASPGRRARRRQVSASPAHRRCRRHARVQPAHRAPARRFRHLDCRWVRRPG